MTTRVIVDAHAGWPVGVQTVDKQEDGEWKVTGEISVPANTEQTFYVTNSRRLIIEEGPRV